MRTLWWLVGGLVAFVLFGACGFEDECDPDATRCVGEQYQVCVGARTIIAGSRPIYEWRDGYCNGLCVGDGVCEPQPDDRCPSCEGDCEPTTWLCAGKSALRCDGQGRLLEESVCDVVCAVGTSKLSNRPLAVCALSPDPEPACEGRESTGGAACVDGQKAHCQAGFVVSFDAENEGGCSASEFCIDTDSLPFCALEPSPNPICAGVKDNDHVCIDGTTIWCQEGFIYERKPSC